MNHKISIWNYLKRCFLGCIARPEGSGRSGSSRPRTTHSRDTYRTRPLVNEPSYFVSRAGVCEFQVFWKQRFYFLKNYPIPSSQCLGTCHREEGTLTRLGVRLDVGTRPGPKREGRPRRVVQESRREGRGTNTERTSGTVTPQTTSLRERDRIP